MAPTTQTPPPAAAAPPVAACWDPQATPTAPDAPAEPFTFGFDFYDNHCSRGVDAVLDDLPDGLLTAEQVELVAAMDDTAAHDWFTTQAAQARAQGDTDLAAELDEAAGRLTDCDGDCCCASDAYFGFGREDLDTNLADLGTHSWVITTDTSRWRCATLREIYRDLRHQDSTQGLLDIETLAKIQTDRSGWSEVNANWDGRRLTVTFSERGSWPELTATPLTPQMESDRDFLMEQGAYEDEAELLAMIYPPTTLQTVRTVWEALGETASYTFDIELAVHDVHDRLNLLTRADMTTLALMGRGWTGTFAEMLDALEAVTAPPAAA